MAGEFGRCSIQQQHTFQNNPRTKTNKTPKFSLKAWLKMR